MINVNISGRETRNISAVGSLCYCNLFIHNKTLKRSPIKHLILKLAHSEYYTQEQREPAAISIKL